MYVINPDNHTYASGEIYSAMSNANFPCGSAHDFAAVSTQDAITGQHGL
ncbi:hypothetical protein NSMM_680002 [Nitrosomonas mobilis]|uniref:Uncharacterized protein n=1 Tax=Nitrosomonas mobilis TaxID=51642 RepID=A0A1G5SHL7_9PROT|nr:hypothetical protein NSMM_680002 [Nitrosomonas mobilis]